MFLEGTISEQVHNKIIKLLIFRKLLNYYKQNETHRNFELLVYFKLFICMQYALHICLNIVTSVSKTFVVYFSQTLLSPTFF